MTQRTWSSRRAFLLATAGAAVGLGNVWRFPFVTGEYGGAAFVVVYLAFVFLIGVPVVAAELAMGRMGHLSPVGSVRAIAREQRASAAWHAIGFFSLAVPFIGLSYYSVVAGWSVRYVGGALAGSFAALDTASSQGLFGELAASPGLNVILQGVVILLTAVVVGGGLQRGIERATTIMMPSLGVLLVVMIGYNLVAADVGAALEFLFAPDFSRLTPTAALVALGQAFFSVGVGVGFMMTYGAYLPREVSVPQAAVIIGAVDTLIALLAGLAVFPIVFASGLSPAEGPGLVFVTMPVAFGAMPLGRILGVLFFLLLFVAAYTTTIGMLEPVVSYLEERWRPGRKVLASVAGVAIWLVGMPPAFSDSLLVGFNPFAMSVFGLYDFVTASVLIPVNALLIALFAGWVVQASAFRREMDLQHEGLFTAWRLLMRYVVPLAILAITVSGLLG